jgi:hypothetical protein
MTVLCLAPVSMLANKKVVEVMDSVQQEST